MKRLLVVLATIAGLSAFTFAPAGASEPHGCEVIHTPGVMSCLAQVVPGVHAVTRPGTAPNGMGLSPAQLRAAYSLPSATAGTGQTVALVDAYNDPDIQADFTNYRAAWGLPAGSLTVVNQNGQASPLPENAPLASEWDLEESLDVETVSAICPNCHVLLVEANTANMYPLATAEDAAVRLGAKFVSNSYGGSEWAGERFYDKFFNHPGVAVTVAAGDDDYWAGVSYPAASPHVVSVGGTYLTPTTANARGWNEVVWNDGGLEGTGSGCSAYEPKPLRQASLIPGCAHRIDNDVSADADPDSGIAVLDTYSEGGWIQVGGTSLASPIIASVYALAGAPPANTYPARFPYRHPGSLNDVTAGNNGTCPSDAPLCTAGPGYDGPTGLGTPDGIEAFQP